MEELNRHIRSEHITEGGIKGSFSYGKDEQASFRSSKENKGGSLACEKMRHRCNSQGEELMNQDRRTEDLSN